MKLKILPLALLLVLASSMTISGVAMADNFGSTGGNGGGLINPLCPNGSQDCQNSDVGGLLRSIVDWLIKIGTPIAVGMLIIGAYQMMFSGGNEDMIKRGRRTILYTAIGYAIILIGWGLTSIIQDFLSH